MEFRTSEKFDCCIVVYSCIHSKSSPFVRVDSCKQSCSCFMASLYAGKIGFVNMRKMAKQKCVMIERTLRFLMKWVKVA